MSNFRKYQSCIFCNMKFMPVEFLIYRQQGYCTEGCMAHEKRTPKSYVDIAYKNGFLLKKVPNNNKD